MPVLAVRLEQHILAKNKLRCCLLRSLAEGLAVFGAVNAIQTDAFSLFIVQNLDDIAVDNGDDEA